MQTILQGWRPYAILTLLCALLYLPGLAAVPPLDRDESRFVQASRQMMVTDDYVTIWFQDEPRHKKPVGIHWLQSASVEAFSDPHSTAVWPYRLVSVLGAVLAVIGTFYFGAALFDRRVAFAAAGILGASLILVTEAHQAKTDAMLLACAVAAQGVFARLYLQSRGGGVAVPGWNVVLFWLAIGWAVMVKGPVVPVVVLLTMLALAVADRSVSWLHGLRPVMGMPLALAVFLPWYLAVGEATDGGFLAEAVGKDLLPKLLAGQESHGAPPGYYLLLATVTFWPGSLFLWPSLWRSWRQRTQPALRFLLAWLVPAWLMFELVPTKLPHYTLPTYPALALMVAAALFAVRDGTWDMLARRGARAWYAVWAVVGVALAVAAVVLPVHYGDGFNALSLPVAAAALAAAAVPLWLAWRRRFLNAMAAGVAAAALTYGGVFAFVLPSLTDLAVSPRLAAAYEAASAPGRPFPLVSTGYSEPSLVFLAGTETRLASPEEAATYVADNPGALAAVESRQQQRFLEVLAERPEVAVTPVDRVQGFNYSRGREVDIILYRSGPS
ncbi:glycosyltransferase family 39 protein [Caenispirillum bisanense]|uniref:ArnT family glycosyltransferase n=1 Tax=Caenispirillum bisanense TaxID=414052 RepID=UPI0031D0BEBB